MLHITDVRPTIGYRLWLRVDDGREGKVDLSTELHGPVFAPLRERARFVEVCVDPEVRTIS